MTTDTTLEEAVSFWANNSNTDEMINRVYAYGNYDNRELTRYRVSIDGGVYYYHVSSGVSSETRRIIEDFIRSYNPPIKHCFSNAVELCAFDERFDYVEGVTAGRERKQVHNHAWNMIDGEVVDVTRSSDERFGVLVENEKVNSVYDVLDRENQWDILLNQKVKL